MKPPNLKLSAATLDDLLAQLAAIDITVPLVTEGRTKEHREQFMMARFLSTKAGSRHLPFPLSVVHTDGPDFLLRLGERRVGVECVEAVPQELYEIEILREIEYPGAMNFGQHFRPGQRTFTQEEKRLIASGELSGPPWMPDASKRNWIAAMEHCIEGKTRKLRGGNYSSTRTTWLLIQDEWPNVVQHYPERLLEAATQLSLNIAGKSSEPTFESIFIGSDKYLLSLAKRNVRIQTIRDLWHYA